MSCVFAHAPYTICGTHQRQANFTITVFHLGGIGIGDEGASALAESLKATLVMRTTRSSLQSCLWHPPFDLDFGRPEKRCVRKTCAVERDMRRGVCAAEVWVACVTFFI